MDLPIYQINQKIKHLREISLASLDISAKKYFQQSYDPKRIEYCVWYIQDHNYLIYQSFPVSI